MLLVRWREVFFPLRAYGKEIVFCQGRKAERAVMALRLEEYLENSHRVTYEEFCENGLCSFNSEAQMRDNFGNDPWVLYVKVNRDHCRSPASRHGRRKKHLTCRG